MKSRNVNTQVLVESAMLVALAFVLSVFPKFDILPYGGSITVCSMLPIILVSYRRGVKWGLLAGLAFALFQMLTGFTAGPGMSVGAVAVVVLFDYLLPFTLIGLGGLFRGKMKPAPALVLGSVVALGLRYVCHVVSGYLVWGEYAEWFFGEAGAFGANVLATFSGNGLAFVYSLVYNATFMLPELILTAAVSVIVARFAEQGLQPKA